MVFYPVTCILIKGWLASSQAGNIGGATRQEVEAGQPEQENSEKRKESVYSYHSDTEEARCDCLAKKGTKPRD